ncbi:phage tail protein [Magnetospirillum moscoviense]|nr:tail fiber protein [Magnetospirillum moscoviense]
MKKSAFAIAPVCGVLSVVAGLSILAPGPAQACGPDYMVGSVCFTAASYCPAGMYYANGSSLTVYQDQVLFSLIGQTYGGSGSSPSTMTYKVPDLQGKIAVGANPSGAGGFVQTAVGTTLGNTTQIMPFTAMPPHSHSATFGINLSQTPPPTITLQASSAPATTNIPSATASNIAGAPFPMWVPTLSAPIVIEGLSVALSGGAASGTVANAVVGNGAAFSIQPPSLVLTMCVAGSGYTYPERPN